MNKRRRPARRAGPPTRILLLAAAASLFACAALLLPFAARAWQQTPTPAAPETKIVVETQRAGGYELRPVSLFLDRWPTVRFDFNILNEAKMPFEHLKASDIKVMLDDRPVKVDEDALRVTGREPSHAVVLIDGSLSMVRSRNVGVNKLQAAKDALLSFNNSLGADDTLSVYAFDAGFYTVSTRTKDKSLLADRIENFEPREDRGPDDKPYNQTTDLYGAVGEALGKARNEQVRNLIVLSDGMQDTPDARAALKSPSAFETYKGREEQAIYDEAKKAGVRIFTIAVGDKNSRPQHPSNLEYVDADTLANMTDEGAGGYHQDIELPKLRQAAQSSTASYQNLLEESLETSFERIRQSFSYGYSLDVRLDDFQRDGRGHMLSMFFPAGSDTFPAVKYPLFWRQGAALPETGKPQVFSAVFLDTPKATVMPVNLGAIYSLGLGLLGMFGLAPLLYLRVQRAKEAQAQERAVARAVITVQENSPYVGKRCPNDQSQPIRVGDTVVVCPRCQRAHHLECWLYVKSRCMVRYCHGELPIPEAVIRRHGIKYT